VVEVVCSSNKDAAAGIATHIDCAG
jgi:hypothetical protein